MYLKSLSLRGFKSFAKPTTFRFEPGITCVVGPNGSGKSNVVDALSWVMGEQGAKNLRGGAMADVIFAGSSGRAGLGRAFVELTIDNSDGLLPIDYAEVTISRTLFRGGGSEYAINGADARLLDVQELLSDTGMGKQMHVIVGQGRLDAVLRATPEERRAFIDEAAGVLKHRRRKERALRKLENMDQNLVRVLDLTEEIKRQLKPLARQAKAARVAEDVLSEIDETSRRLIAEDLVRARERHERDTALAQQARDRVEGSSSESHSLELRLRELEGKLENVDQYVRGYTEMTHQFDSVRERLASLVGIAMERISSHTGREVVSEAQIDLARQNVQGARKEAQDLAADAQAKTESLSRTREQRKNAEEAEQEARKNLHYAEEALSRRQTESSRLLQAVARTQSRYEEAQAALERAENERLQAAKDLASLPLPAQPDESEDTSEVLSTHHTRMALEESEARKALEEARKEESTIQAALAKWQGQRQALEPKKPEFKELDDGRWAPQGQLVDRLTVAVGWEKAISALLGTFDEAVIVGENDSVASGLRWASETGIGLRAVVSGNADTPVEGNAWEAVESTRGLDGAIAELLDGAWLAEDLDEAQALLQRPGVRKVATRDGIVLGRRTIAGGSTDMQAALVVRAEWKNARAEEERCEKALRLAQERVGRAKNHLQQASASTAEAMSKLREFDARSARLAKERAEEAARRAAAVAREERAAQEVLRRTTAVEESAQAAREAAQAAEAMPEVNAESFLKEPRQALDQATQRLRVVRETEMKAEVAAREARDKAQAAARALQVMTDRVRMLEDDRRRGLEEATAQERRKSHLLDVHKRADAGRNEAAKHYATALALREKYEAQASELKEEIVRVRTDLERHRSSQSHADEIRRQAEVALAQSALMMDEATKRAEELSDDIEALIASHGPHIPVIDSEGNAVPYSRADIQERLEQARTRLARLGVVNPLALEEHKALSERLQFLEDQVADLQKSKRDLLAIIRDVDTQIRVAFEEAFAQTADEFDTVFAGLFPGGKGRLSLTDPDDPLHTGVEIYARPAGKKVTRLSLLSGGERSLAALAYLIAIFKARPSPFYVMDEVEAALDDINLSRVLTAFSDLQKTSQLILITHQKRTMEIADALYGVSMRDGVSQVISHRLSQERYKS